MKFLDSFPLNLIKNKCQHRKCFNHFSCEDNSQKETQRGSHIQGKSSAKKSEPWIKLTLKKPKLPLDLIIFMSVCIAFFVTWNHSTLADQK